MFESMVHYSTNALTLLRPLPEREGGQSGGLGGFIRISVLAWLLVTLVFVAAAMVIMSRTAGVRRQFVPVPGTSTIDAAQVINGVSEATVRNHLDAMSAWPTRMPGTAGHDGTARHIRGVFEELGLRIVEHPFEVTVPVTVYCELLDEQGRPIPGVALHPFWPNVVRTCTIPEPGVRGKAVLGEAGHLFEFSGRDPAATIPLLRLSVSEQWIGLADAGFAAVIFCVDESVRPRHYRTKELDFPGDFPRFVLVGDPRPLKGRSVRLRCRVDWRTLTVSNLIGVLAPPQEQVEHPVWQKAQEDLRQVFLEDVRRVIEVEVDGAQEQLITTDLARVRSGSVADSPQVRAYHTSRKRV